jgi:asparagine synthase (glutamine-hydrolysing)
MCGIAGIVRSEVNENDDRVVHAMIEQVKYRGPNGQYIVRSGSTVFGHARLSIIDLHERSNQPFWSEDRRFCIIFNGEIYNYIELRNELKNLGHRFRTEGDVEVLLTGFCQWGDACWHRFNGMWAVAIWDVVAQRLVLSRDRFGVKPLYYSVSNKDLFFGSEIKEIIDAKAENPAPRWQEVYRMFDRAPRSGTDTVFDGIQALPPGHEFSFFPLADKHSLRRWYRLMPQNTKEEDLVRKFRELFIDAVRLRLRSDVPVGICLSGGLDSSVIACVMARELGVRPRTFSTVYSEKEYSEERFLDSVIDQVGASALKITPRDSDFIEVMSKIVMHHDEPIQMPGTYSQWHVMEMAGPHVRVLLDGQGGDEVIAGYNSFYPAYARSLILDLLRFNAGKERIEDLLRLFLDQSKIGGTMKSLGRASLPSLRRRESTAWKDRVFTTLFRDKQEREIRKEQDIDIRLPDSLSKEMYLQLTDRNLPMLLKYEDRLSMAFSIESRVPFLDYRLVEFCFGLPYHMKMKGITTKWILREAFRDILPEIVANRIDKKGFPTPLSLWMRGDVGKNMMSTIETASRVEGEFGYIFDFGSIQRLFNEHAKGIANHERILFRVFTTALWYLQWYSR